MDNYLRTYSKKLKYGWGLSISEEDIKKMTPKKGFYRFIVNERREPSEFNVLSVKEDTWEPDPNFKGSNGQSDPSGHTSPDPDVDKLPF